MRAGQRQLGGVEGRRLVEGENPEGLEAARPLDGLDDDPGALVGGLVAVPPQAGHVQEHDRQAVVRHDEAEALGDVEPLDPAADLDQLERPIPGRILSCLAVGGADGLRLPLRSVRAGTVIVGHEQTQRRIGPAILNEKITPS